MLNSSTRITAKNYAICALATAVLLGTAACSEMSRQDKNTAVGAGAGAVGGLIGHEVDL
jgi:osmotically inducible lipoprotein OsmB